MSYTTIGNVNWYHFLVVKERHRSLFSDYPRETLREKFTVCWDYKDHDTDKIVKLYAVFPNYVHFVKFFFTVPEPLQSFYEIVLGENYQKPHFDVDIDSSDSELGKQILSDLITGIVKVLSDYGIVLDLPRDICIYTSHGVNKQSYHVIVNGWCHTNHNEAKAFYHLVMAELPSEYGEKKWIDSSVYSKTQQFRTYGSCKTGTDRRKKLLLTWNFGESRIEHVRETDDDPQLQFLEDFERSLVTSTVRRCKILPSLVDTEVNRERYTPSEGTISKDLAWEAIQLLAHKAGVTPDHPKFPYRFSDIEGSLILLKRERPSRCRVCNRVHEHENPYLLYQPETGDVYFDCRRSVGGKKMYVGCLGAKDDDCEPLSNDSSNDLPDGSPNLSPNLSPNDLPRERDDRSSQDSPQRKWYLEKIQQLAKREIKSKPKKVVDPSAHEALMEKMRSAI